MWKIDFIYCYANMYNRKRAGHNIEPWELSCNNPRVVKYDHCDQVIWSPKGNRAIGWNSISVCCCASQRRHQGSNCGDKWNIGQIWNLILSNIPSRMCIVFFFCRNAVFYTRVVQRSLTTMFHFMKWILKSKFSKCFSSTEFDLSERLAEVGKHGLQKWWKCLLF